METKTTSEETGAYQYLNNKKKLTSQSFSFGGADGDYTLIMNAFDQCFFRVTSPGFCPRKQTNGSVGYDLASPVTFILEPGRIEKLSIGVAVDFPDKYGGLIKERSSMALLGGMCLGGVIDTDYDKELSVIITNLSKAPIVIERGDFFAQLVIFSCGNIKANATTEFGKDISTSVGGNAIRTGGFGSTPKNAADL